MKHNLDSFQEDDATYFRLYASCPVCMKNGKPTEPAFWFHYDNNCYGDVYVGDDAFFKCIKCGCSSHVSSVSVLTSCHPCSNTSEAALQWRVSAIGFAGQLVETVGMPWLQHFLKR